jgi:transcriptional regulator with XRE-family HTH domain
MLAESLRRLLDERGWSIETASKRTGLHRQMISKILRGEITRPRLDTLIKLSDTFGVSIDELAGRRMRYCFDGETK